MYTLKWFFKSTVENKIIFFNCIKVYHLSKIHSFNCIKFYILSKRLLSNCMTFCYFIKIYLVTAVRSNFNTIELSLLLVRFCIKFHTLSKMYDVFQLDSNWNRSKLVRSSVVDHSFIMRSASCDRRTNVLSVEPHSELHVFKPDTIVYEYSKFLGWPRPYHFQSVRYYNNFIRF